MNPEIIRLKAELTAAKANSVASLKAWRQSETERDALQATVDRQKEFVRILKSCAEDAIEEGYKTLTATHWLEEIENLETGRPFCS